jgi:hypothetical protein
MGASKALFCNTVIARLLNVNRLTVRNYIKTRKLDR